ncbi:MAG: cytochrome c [bacterium]|nr:cytochrome c [bacterium]MDE0501584.1 cytochrome c [bacterium]
MSHRGRQGLRIALTAASLCLFLAGCGEERPENDPQVFHIAAPPLSETALLGAEHFIAHCTECHGANAGGTSEGPPLVHIYYEPGHHADISFHIAVRQGTRQHHWEFGDMDPVPGLSDEEVNEIICYVRELQYANDIFTDPAGLAACQS